MIMYEEIFTVLGGVVAGGVAGSIVSRRCVIRSIGKRSPTATSTVSDSVTNTWIDQAATEWATKTGGRPEAKRLIASKLRLGLHLQQQRQQEGQS